MTLAQLQIRIVWVFTARSAGPLVVLVGAARRLVRPGTMGVLRLRMRQGLAWWREQTHNEGVWLLLPVIGVGGSSFLRRRAVLVLLVRLASGSKCLGRSRLLYLCLAAFPRECEHGAWLADWMLDFKTGRGRPLIATLVKLDALHWVRHQVSDGLNSALREDGRRSPAVSEL